MGFFGTAWNFFLRRSAFAQADLTGAALGFLLSMVLAAISLTAFGQNSGPNVVGYWKMTVVAPEAPTKHNRKPKQDYRKAKPSDVTKVLTISQSGGQLQAVMKEKEGEVKFSGTITGKHSFHLNAVVGSPPANLGPPFPFGTGDGHWREIQLDGNLDRHGMMTGLTAVLEKVVSGTVRFASSPDVSHWIAERIAAPVASPADDYFSSGNAKRAKGDKDGAIADYTNAIQLKPDYAEAYYVRGEVKRARFEWDGAIGDYGKAVQLKPDYAEAYYSRGEVERAKFDWGGAVADYNKAIQLKPDYAEAYYNRGSAEEHKGDFDGAIADYSRALQLRPDDAVAYNSRGSAEEHKGNFGGAIANYTKAIQLQSDYALANGNRSRLMQSGHTASGQELIPNGTPVPRPAPFHPAVGSGVEHLLTGRGVAGGRIMFRNVVVGQEAGGYWIEDEFRLEANRVLTRSLWVGDPPVLKRRIMSAGGGGWTGMPVAAAAKGLGWAASAVKAGTEWVAVPAGTFECDHYVSDLNNKRFDIWISSKVPTIDPPEYGMVKRTSAGDTLELQRIFEHETSQMSQSENLPKRKGK